MVGGVVALVLLAVAVVVVVDPFGDDTREQRVRAARSAGASFDDAVLLAPGDAERVLWTDWAGIRDELGVDLDASSTPEQVEDLLDRGFDANLTATTALESSASTLQESFGFSPATLEWELFTQSPQAATLTMHLGDGVTTDDVAEALRALQYAEPAEPDGVWRGDADLAVAGDVTPELTFIALDRAHDLVFASDQPTGVDAAVEAAAAADSEPVPDEVVAGLGSPLSAVAYNSTYVCSALAMAGADPDDQAEADTLVAQAGRINPLTGYAIGAEPGGLVRVALGFENEDQAGANALSRGQLASGPAPGQGGDFTDRFTLGPVQVDGDVVTMELDPVEGQFVVSELSDGPVLFATC
ncbi:hypothetical protein [Nocardioides rubriscoriae]|uniref:hypothetical protein n=1 Tax=Nocardioides rubriscoriae TaxID=642762 RepID=UPI0011DFAE3F|nr:hypothetical protein [Nocardioides rubriscoriae]